jgi:hypothetical protein
VDDHRRLAVATAGEAQQAEAKAIGGVEIVGRDIGVSYPFQRVLRNLTVYGSPPEVGFRRILRVVSNSIFSNKELIQADLTVTARTK